MLQKASFDTTGWNDESLAALAQFKAAPAQFFAPDPTEASAALGGIVACNASGSRSYAYGAVAAVGGAGMLYCAAAIYRLREGVAATRACWRMFGFSILYLFALFATLLLEHLLGPLIGRLL